MTIAINDILNPQSKIRLKQTLEKYNVICLGPGLGQSNQSINILKKIIKHSCQPLVLDADALNILANKNNLLRNYPNKIILTPHPKEAARLLRIDTKEVESNRIDAAEQIARKFNCYVVLKGANTIVTNGESNFIHLSGTPAQSSAGMGDLLSGMITSFLAQGYCPYNSSNLAVSYLGLASEKLELEIGPFGIQASEVAKQIPKIAKEFINYN